MPKKKTVGRPRQRHSANEENLPLPHQTPEMLEEQPQPQEELPPQLPEEEEEEERADDKEDQKEEEPQADVTVPEISAPNPRGRKKKPLTEKQRALAQQKLALLEENFHPIPFSPNKTLDLSTHEHLFRALNLWDFVNLNLTHEIRSDLLTFLIANYDPQNRCSRVNNFRISVSRSDLARALALPVKKEKGESQQEIFLKDESKEVIEYFMSNYILLEDDMCILPPEVLTASQLVKEGQANKVDWAGLVWVLVEKELLEAPRSGSCYYASHLQCLMKHQRPGLFEKEAEPVPVPEPELSMEVSVAEEEDDGDDGGEIKMRSLEEFQDVGSEKLGPELSLGLGENGDPMDGIEDCKGGEEEQWLDGGKNEGFEHCLQRCNSNDVRGMEFENLCKGEQEGREEEFSNLERLTSTDLLQAMETVRVSYSPQMNSLDPSSGDFLSTRVDANKNMTLDPGPGGSLFFENNGKRHIGDIADDEDEIHRFHQNNQQKRMRSGGIWEELPPSDFDSYVEQIQCSMGKAKMLFVEKEQACMRAHLQLQYLNEMIEEKDQIIRTLEKTRVEEQQKWHHAICRYENELNVMAHLMLGYKKVLRETRNKFAEYRKKCSQGDEPLYKDVGGTGGVVLSLRELERQQLEKEEEMRQTAEEIINGFQNEWLTKLEEHAESLMMLHRRLLGLDGEVKLLKERYVETKGLDT